MGEEPRIIVITGAQGAGKSTCGPLLAARFDRGAYVEGDAFQKMIVTGGVWVTDVQGPGAVTDEPALQLRLRLRNACLVARSFFEAGFTTVIDDIIAGDRWRHLREDLRGLPFYIIVLAPSVATLQARDLARTNSAGGDWAEYLDGEIRKTLGSLGLWVDSTRQTPAETVDEIVRRLDEGLIES